MRYSGRMDGWKAVPGYAGYYEANDQLWAVRSLDRIIYDRLGRLRRMRGRVLLGTGNNPNAIILSRDGIQTVFTVYEVIEMTFGVEATISA